MHYDLTSSSIFTSGRLSSEHQKRPYLKCQPTSQHIEPASHYRYGSLLNVDIFLLLWKIHKGQYLTVSPLRTNGWKCDVGIVASLCSNWSPIQSPEIILTISSPHSRQALIIYWDSGASMNARLDFPMQFIWLFQLVVSFRCNLQVVNMLCSYSLTLN